MSPLFIELLGYLASALVVVSLMMARLLWLRVVNLAGAATFTVYGLVIGSLPVALTNGIIVLIDCYYLWRMTRTRSFFQLLEVDADSAYLRQFLAFYADDIRRFIPEAPLEPDPARLHLFVLRDMVPAGLFVAERRGADPAAATAGGAAPAEVKLDYAIPGYRDYRIGRFLYHDRADELRARGLTRLRARAGSDAQARYLQRMGFRPDADGVLEKRLR